MFGALPMNVEFITPDDHRLMNDVGACHLSEFEKFGYHDSLVAAFEYHSRAVSMISFEHPDLFLCLGNLGLCYGVRFRQLGDMKDLDIAIEHFSKAILLAPEWYTGNVNRIGELGELYRDRYQLTGNISDSMMSIESFNKALALLPEDDSRMSSLLYGLGAIFSDRHNRRGDLKDSDEAIHAFNLAAQCAPENMRHNSLDHLGMQYMFRYRSLNNPNDLQKAVEHMEKALLYRPGEAHDELNCLTYRGLAHIQRLELWGEPADEDTALQCFKEAIECTPRRLSPDYYSLGAIAFAFGCIFKISGDFGYLDWAISSWRQALDSLMINSEHPLVYVFLCNLAQSYHTRFTHLKKVNDLDNTIILLQQASAVSSDKQVTLPFILHELGGVCFEKFEISEDIQYINMAMKYYYECTQSTVGQNYYRLRGVVQLVGLAYKYIGSEAAIAGCRILFDLIPEYVWLGVSNSNQYERTLHLHELVTMAVAIAIESKEYDIALEWIEQGRSVVWGQILKLRTPLDELFAVDASLAEQLQGLSKKIEQLSAGHELNTGQLQSFSHAIGYTFPGKSDVSVPLLGFPAFEQSSQLLRRLTEAREQLITNIRLLPKMSSFLKPMHLNQITLDPGFGVVVLFNFSRETSNALVVIPGSNDTKCVLLNSAAYQNITAARDTLAKPLCDRGRTNRKVTYFPKVDDSIEGVLQMLWTDIAKPLLDFLGYDEVKPLDRKPHVTWCTTGPLAFLPLHAAGDYRTPGSLLSDFAVSSFTTSLGALAGPCADILPRTGILAVGQSSTAGLPSLPGTIEEIEAISNQVLGEHFCRLEGEYATALAVLEAMEHHSWVHLACHASQDTTQPTDSAFSLHNGPLSLSVIAQKQFKNADLAFLSACQTATGNVKLSEEAVHLAAGMIMSGYRRVIATMWSINDQDAPFVAEKFYSYMLDDTKPHCRKAGRALHYAVSCLQHKIGVKEFARWAPFVHFGH